MRAGQGRDMLPVRRSRATRADGEQGVALIVALLSLSLLMALSMALTMTTLTQIVTHHRAGSAAMYAADAGVEWMARELSREADWNALLAGTARSDFVDGPAGGIRVLPGGGSLNLTEATHMLSCGKKSACSDADLDRVTDERPWGPNNPRWQLYAHGAIDQLLGTNTADSRMYVVVWIGDDPAENDGNRSRDGDPPVSGLENPGRGVLAMLVRAYGPRGIRRTIEATVAFSDASATEPGDIGQDEQDEQNRQDNFNAGPGQTAIRMLSWRHVR